MTPERIVDWTTKAGISTRSLAERIIRTRDHPQQAFRSCLGLMHLGKIYGEERLEAACARALQVNATSYTSVKSVLKNGLDREPLRVAPALPPIDHPNIRGAEYYEGEPSC